ncbi:hypothetical protein JDV02_009712 [Purpureocillium takamizusanense]|uniref:Uncharacterized protein n=1 Tax=Purpureocillium takamizusanense TaxID=2060973 RepID=A0A9Q8QRE5_9HYPO|nr:uncharacterized protein JDV02_009712 [Purpureocillium takamizusanense]UNI23921.1 hypothetical protein JDV02_009712 [Purpureocillium takamizusanense]
MKRKTNTQPRTRGPLDALCLLHSSTHSYPLAKIPCGINSAHFASWLVQCCVSKQQPNSDNKSSGDKMRLAVATTLVAAVAGLVPERATDHANSNNSNISTRSNSINSDEGNSHHDDNSNANSNGNNADKNNDNTTPGAYTLTIYNSDCWCRRGRMRMCTSYKRDGVLDGRCYPISHYARSMQAYDPLISMHNRLVCKAWQGLRCDGLGLELGFVDNTRCREPVAGEEFKLEYRSFSCHHE